MAATETIQVRLTREELADLDRIRGEETRGGLIKGLCRGAVGARERQGTPTNLFVINERERARLGP